jgi:hypothetical protein
LRCVSRSTTKYDIEQKEITEDFGLNTIFCWKKYQKSNRVYQKQEIITRGEVASALTNHRQMLVFPSCDVTAGGLSF